MLVIQEEEVSKFVNSPAPVTQETLELVRDKIQQREEHLTHEMRTPCTHSQSRRSM